jgi:hypothetical protein
MTQTSATPAVLAAAATPPPVGVLVQRLAHLDEPDIECGLLCSATASVFARDAA